MKIVSDHGWPVASDGTDGHGLEAFKNERDYIAQSGRLQTTVAAMDWAAREIERLQAEQPNMRCTVCGLVVDLRWKAEFPNDRGRNSDLDPHRPEAETK